MLKMLKMASKVVESRPGKACSRISNVAKKQSLQMMLGWIEVTRSTAVELSPLMAPVM